jgi:hypothetical protein
LIAAYLRIYRLDADDPALDDVEVVVLIVLTDFGRSADDDKSSQQGGKQSLLHGKIPLRALNSATDMRRASTLHPPLWLPGMLRSGLTVPC